MNAWTLIWRNLAHRKSLSLLTVFSVAVTIALFAVLLLSKDGIEQGAEKGYGPFELVIGADGSESQLVMSTFYRVGTPTGNIPHDTLDAVRQEPEIDAAFGMTTGDNYNGFPIVGVDPGYFQIRYADRPLASGSLYRETGEVAVGYYAAKELGVQVGDTFRGAHGLVDEHALEEEHEEDGHEDEHSRFAYKVVGILPKLNTPDDRAVFTTIDYAWAVHAGQSEHRDITAIIVKPKSLLGAQSMKLKYDKLDNVQAVYASKAVADVLNMVDTGTRLVTIAMAICVVLAAVSMLLSLTAAVQERKKDVGLLRLIGKTRSFIMLTLLGEGLLLTVMGLISGLLLGHLTAWIVSDAVFTSTGVQINGLHMAAGEPALALTAIALGAVAALGPAIRLYRVDPLTLFRN